MKHRPHLRRAAFLVAALAIAGQARALGGSSGQGTASTGGPQGTYEGHLAAPGSLAAMNQRGADGVPTWYSVDTSARPPPARGPVMVVRRSRAVPSWYAID